MDDLLADEPKNNVWKRELSISRNRIGEALARDGQYEEALAGSVANFAQEVMKGQ